MKIELEPVAYEDKAVLQRLIELYQYDFSEWEETDVTEHGTFGYRFLDNYWTESGRRALFIKVEGRHAGFVLVRTLEDGRRMISEFFVMRKYRRTGVGAAAAHEVFDAMRGRWEVAQQMQNTVAQAFWRQVLAVYGPVETVEDDGRTVVQRFSNEELR